MIDRVTNKVVTRINNYLSNLNGVITIDMILGGTDAVVFGGAVRDAIHGSPINDIDIMGFRQSIEDIATYLKNEGFIEQPTDPLLDLYEEIALFNSPTTLCRGDCKVQLIQLILHSPFMGMTKDSVTTLGCRKKLVEAVANVDIDICAVYYHKNTGVQEALVGVINYIDQGVFHSMKDNIMHVAGRIEGRIVKLEKKGYKHLITSTSAKTSNSTRLNLWG